MKIKGCGGNWSKALTEIKDFLKEYQPNVYPKVANPPPGPGIMINYGSQNNSSKFLPINTLFIHVFRWRL